MKICINSEIGKLEGVIIHSPGPEVENMTPATAQRALYSDILNLSIASQEYDQLVGVLKKISHVFEVSNLLTTVLEDRDVTSEILKQVGKNENINNLERKLIEKDHEEISHILIEGLLLMKDNLTNYLSSEFFMLRPLHNLFFVRDPAMAVNDSILIGKMANRVREREALIMNVIFRHHPFLKNKTVSSGSSEVNVNEAVNIEGGDFLVARDDIYIIGTGVRTSTQGIDFIIENLKRDKNRPFHIIVQELPSTPESFIHLDMVFTLLDKGYYMVYSPVIFNMGRFHTIHIKVENNNVISIEEQPDILYTLKKLGMDLKPVFCGGNNHLWVQEREQWHSGANFFAFEPGKIIGYERNVHTLEALNNNGFEIIKATDIIENKVSPDEYKRCVVTIAGSELARGGGGARCMTMPVRRADVNW